MFRPVSPYPDQLVVCGRKLVVETADLVTSDQVWLPDAAGGQLDDVDAVPLGRVPGQPRVQPAQHQLALQLGRVEVVVGPDHVVDVDCGLDRVRVFDVRRSDAVLRVGVGEEVYEFVIACFLCLFGRERGWRIV